MKTGVVSLGLGLALTILSLVNGAYGSRNATFDLLETAKISACGLTKCVIWTVPEVGCDLLDTECHCRKDVVHRLATISANCMYANCTFAEALDLAKIQAALCDFPAESQTEYLIIMTTVCAVITYATVGLRIATRFLLGLNLGIDDYFIIAAAASDAVFTSFGGLLEHKGFGNHIWNVDVDAVPTLLLYFYIGELSYVITIALIKFSILFFYLKIFPKPIFRLTCWLTMAFCTMTAIAFILVTVFQCKPIHYVWRKDVEGTCVNYNAVAWANAGVNIVQDILILVIPISELKGLQLNLKRKIGMYAMFSVGGLVCVFSMVRLDSLKMFGLTADPTYDNVNTTFWTTLETTSAIVLACMPSIRALAVRYFPKLVGGTTSNKSGNGKGTLASGIQLSHTTHIYSVRATEEELDNRPESQESWIGRTGTGVSTTSIIGGKAAYHNTFNNKPAFPVATETELANMESDSTKKSGGSSSSSMDADWDKSLPTTPNTKNPLASADAGKETTKTHRPHYSNRSDPKDMLAPARKPWSPQ